MSHKSDASQLVRSLRREGFTVQLTQGSHWEVRSPDGEHVTVFPGSPSDKRWRANTLACIRRWKRDHAWLSARNRR